MQTKENMCCVWFTTHITAIGYEAYFLQRYVWYSTYSMCGMTMDFTAYKKTNDAASSH